MHSEFSEWFRAANLPVQGDELQRRWAGVDAFNVGRNEVISLVELFFGYLGDKESFLAAFRKAFQDADSSFRMRDNNLELSVLAGATLVSVMEGSAIDLGDFAAIALVSCAAQNLRAAPCIPDIPELAARHLARRTVSRRLLDADEQAELDESVAEVKQLRRDLDVIGEESNVLWWVFGETSRDTNERWSEHSVSQAALMAGKELANLTKVAPGPAAAAALLDRIIKNTKSKAQTQVAVKDAIADISIEWRKKFVKDCYIAPLAQLSPISHGIKLSVDLADRDAWLQTFGSSTRIQRGGKIAPKLLAYQIYLECLLATVWTQLE